MNQELFLFIVSLTLLFSTSRALLIWILLLSLLRVILTLLKIKKLLSILFLIEFGSLILIQGIFYSNSSLILLGLFIEIAWAPLLFFFIPSLVIGNSMKRPSVLFFLSIYKVGFIYILILFTRVSLVFIISFLVLIQGMSSFFMFNPFILFSLNRNCSTFLLVLFSLFDLNLSILYLLIYLLSGVLILGGFWLIGRQDTSLFLMLSWSPLQVSFLLKILSVSISLSYFLVYLFSLSLVIIRLLQRVSLIQNRLKFRESLWPLFSFHLYLLGLFLCI